MYTCTYTYSYTYAYTNTYTHAHTCACVYAHTCTYPYPYTFIFIHRTGGFARAKTYKGPVLEVRPHGSKLGNSQKSPRYRTPKSSLLANPLGLGVGQSA